MESSPEIPTPPPEEKPVKTSSGVPPESTSEGDAPEESVSDVPSPDAETLAAVFEEAAATVAAQHLADLQRVSAEYANYRKRTEENRVVERERAIGDVAIQLLPVLDDLERAEKHGDLVEGTAFATIAAKLRACVERLGLSSYAQAGDPFDPHLHEAIFQKPTADSAVETVAEVVETGYMIGSTTLRVAKVVVAVPEEPNQAPTA